jgi:hypothetical protein
MTSQEILQASFPKATDEELAKISVSVNVLRDSFNVGKKDMSGCSSHRNPTK